MISDPLRIVLPYGDGAVEATIPGAQLLAQLDIRETATLENPARAVADALADPFGMEGNLLDPVRAEHTVCLVVSDSFRQTRADVVVPVLLSGFTDRGVKMQNVSIVFSTGTHRGPTAEEQRAILGDSIYEEFTGRLFIHDAHDSENRVSLGTTRRGTPVSVNRLACECDHLIATGAVVMHYFGGFGGGRKSIVPGLASVDTIAHNHALNLHPTQDTLDPAVHIGVMQGNPVAEDMLEAARRVPILGIVNTVLDRNGAIAGVFAGELEQAHNEACDFARSLYAIPIHEQADLVVAASATTRNFVQTHKALFNAFQAVKSGGRIVLAAPCPEGLGGEQFVKWLRLDTREAIISALRSNSEINGQTALSTLEKAPRTTFVTEMSEDEVSLLHGTKSDTLQSAIEQALGQLAPPTVTCIVMPDAAYTVPCLGG